MCRIGSRSNDDEVVVHHVVPLHRETFGKKLLFRVLVVDEHNIGIAAPADIESLSGADRYHIDAN